MQKSVGGFSALQIMPSTPSSNSQIESLLQNSLPWTEDTQNKPEMAGHVEQQHFGEKREGKLECQSRDFIRHGEVLASRYRRLICILASNSLKWEQAASLVHLFWLSNYRLVTGGTGEIRSILPAPLFRQ